MTGPLAQQFAQVREGLSMWLRGEPPQTAIGMGHGEVIAALSVIEQWATDVALHVQDMETALLLYTGYTEMVKRDPDYDMDGIEWEHIYEQARAALPAREKGTPPPPEPEVRKPPAIERRPF